MILVLCKVCISPFNLSRNFCGVLRFSQMPAAHLWSWQVASLGVYTAFHFQLQKHIISGFRKKSRRRRPQLKSSRSVRRFQFGRVECVASLTRNAICDLLFARRAGNARFNQMSIFGVSCPETRRKHNKSHALWRLVHAFRQQQACRARICQSRSSSCEMAMQNNTTRHSLVASPSVVLKFGENVLLLQALQELDVKRGAISGTRVFSRRFQRQVIRNSLD